VLAAELDGDVEGLLIGEAPVLRSKRLAADLQPAAWSSPICRAIASAVPG
jgi:hypothetical protein